MSPSSRLLGLLLVVGGFTQCSQAVLLRELLAAFQGVELALGAFYGSWLAWIGLGGALATRLSHRPHHQHLLQGGVMALPLAVLTGILLLRFARFLLQVPESEFIPLGSFLLLTATATLPGGLLLGMIFPAACRLLVQFSTNSGIVPSITSLYLVESLGALMGGVLFTFLLVESLGSWVSFALTATLMLLANLFVLPNPQERFPLRLLSALLLLVFGLLALPWPGQPLLARLESRHFQMVHPGMLRVAGVESRFGQVTLAQLGKQFSLLHDGRLGESFPDPHRARLTAAYLLAQSPSPLRILLLGGGGKRIAGRDAALSHPATHSGGRGRHRPGHAATLVARQ
ncbi:MAG: hypothetical protein G8345_17745 [Magnetococcales bacterium]|nr:hypothetical protein [Magnetococcales bacterium]